MTVPILLMSLSVMAQADLRKKIEVTTYAERTVVPDRIFLNITLKEYKNGNRIVPMDRLEEGLVKALRKLDIPENQLTVNDMYGYNWDWRKKRPDDFLASKSFRLEVPDLKKINDLVEYLDPEGLQSIGILEVRHSQEEEIREELAREALIKAREKATAMLRAIDEAPGGVIEVTAFEQRPGNPRPQMRMMEAAESSAYSSDVDFRNIDLRVEVRAVFEIK